MWDLVPWPGITPRAPPLTPHWEHGVLATGPPGKFPHRSFFKQKWPISVGLLFKKPVSWKGTSHSSNGFRERCFGACNNVRNRIPGQPLRLLPFSSTHRAPVRPQTHVGMSVSGGRAWSDLHVRRQPSPVRRGNRTELPAAGGQGLKGWGTMGRGGAGQGRREWRGCCGRGLRLGFLVYLLGRRYFLKMYFWLRWVFVAAHRLSLVVVSRNYSSLWCKGFSLWWLLLLRKMDSRWVSFRSCSAQAQ